MAPVLSFCLLLSAGVRSWEDVDPAVCSLDEQLKAFVSRHSATFSSIVKGDLPHSASLGPSATHWMQAAEWQLYAGHGVRHCGGLHRGTSAVCMLPWLWDSRSKLYDLFLTYRRLQRCRASSQGILGWLEQPLRGYCL